MPFVSVDLYRYQRALSNLGREKQEAIETIPKQMAEAFAAAKKICCLADFHRPTDTRDAAWYESDAKLKINATFVHDRGLFVYGAPLRTDSLVLSLNGELAILGGQTASARGSGAKERCDYVFGVTNFDPEELDCFVLLLCFEGVDLDLVREVKKMGGFVIVIQDRGGEANDPFVDPKHFDFRLGAEDFAGIVQALVSLREEYAKYARNPQVRK